MKEWEEQFIETTFKALRKEQRELYRRSERRSGYDIFDWGVASAFETGLVFTVYKHLLENEFFDEWELIWEDSYPNMRCHKIVDLSLRKKWSKKYYVEAKWYSVTAVKEDYEKLKKIVRRSDVGGGYLLLFHARPTNMRHYSLKRKIEEGTLGRCIARNSRLHWVDEEKPIRHFKIHQYNYNDELAEGIFEIAFLKVT